MGLSLSKNIVVLLGFRFLPPRSFALSTLLLAFFARGVWLARPESDPSSTASLSVLGQPKILTPPYSTLTSPTLGIEATVEQPPWCG